MQVTQAEPAFRPVTIVLETKDEYDMLVAVVHQVAENKINHAPSVISAAYLIRSRLTSDISED